MSATFTIRMPDLSRAYYVGGGRSKESEAMQMKAIADGLAKGERIGLGTDNIERWLKRYELLHGTRPKVEPLGDAKDLYILTKP